MGNAVRIDTRDEVSSAKVVQIYPREIPVPELLQHELGRRVWFETGPDGKGTYGVYPFSEKGRVFNYSSAAEGLKRERAEEIARQAGENWDSWTWGAYHFSRSSKNGGSEQ